MNHAPADHNLVTWVHQLEVGERRAAPLELTPPGGFLAIEEGGLRMPPSRWNLIGVPDLLRFTLNTARFSNHAGDLQRHGDRRKRRPRDGGR